MPVRGTGAPMGMPFEKNVTRPVAPISTMAVSVTDWPLTGGLGNAVRITVAVGQATIFTAGAGTDVSANRGIGADELALVTPLVGP